MPRLARARNTKRLARSFFSRRATPGARRGFPFIDGAPLASCGAPLASSTAPLASCGAPLASCGAPLASDGAPLASCGAPLASDGAPLASGGAPLGSGGAPLASGPGVRIIRGTPGGRHARHFGVGFGLDLPSFTASRAHASRYAEVAFERDQLVQAQVTPLTGP